MKRQHGSDNSTLIPTQADESSCTSAFVDQVLLYESHYNRLYRVSRDGKYFIIKTARDSSDRIQSLIRREYEMSIGISSPYIAHVYVYDTHTIVGPGIVMEYIDGRTLTDFLAENPAQHIRKRVFDQLLEAVGYLHQKGILHNDLKPENILISRSDNTVKLLDFGLSDDDAHYFLTTPGCTPKYASPELQKRLVPLDARSDIYSIGLLMKDIFGKKYRNISIKASSNDSARRYDNIEQLQKALRNRSRLPLFISVILLIFIAFIPYLFIFQDSDSRNRELETLSSEMNAALKLPTERFLERINEIGFYEFAIIESQGLMHEYWNIRDSIVATVNIEQHKAEILSLYVLQSAKLMEEVTSKIESIPKMSECSLPVEEYNFYCELLRNQQPYRSYGK